MRKTSRTISRTAASLLILVCGVFGLSGVWAPTAHAGGPTSVLLAAPDQSEVTALYYTDDAYAELRHQVEASADGPGAEPYEGDFNRQIRLTWMIHDLSVWRQDIIHLDAPDGWLIETRELDADSQLSEPTFHRPADQERLESALAAAGLGSDPTPTRTDNATLTARTPPLTLIGVGLGGLIVGAGGYHLVRRRLAARIELDG